jgi:hypothetical protein
VYGIEENKDLVSEVARSSKRSGNLVSHFNELWIFAITGYPLSTLNHSVFGPVLDRLSQFLSSVIIFRRDHVVAGRCDF